MSSWPTTPLGELILTLETGSRPKGGVGEIADGIPSVSGEHINREGGFYWDTPKHVSPDFYASMKRGRIQRGDILVVKDGATTGKTAIVRDNFPFREAAINEHVFLLRTDTNKALPEYVGYFLFSPIGQQQILSNFRGAAIGGIAQDFVRNVHVPLAPLREQVRLVKLLDGADELLKLRTQADRHTAALIPALFHGMFGDPEHTSLPVKPLIELVAGERPITYGILKPGPNIDGGIPYVRVVDIKQHHLHVEQLQKTSEDIALQYRRSTLLPGDILVTIRGSVGRTCIVPSHLKGANITQDTARIAAISSMEPVYLVEFLNTPWAQSWMSRHTQGQAVKGMNLGDLKVLPVPVPPLSLQNEFAARVTEIRAMQVEQAASRQRLVALFQSLLSGAFAGTA